ncbi:disease resistance protein RUN1-like [Cornus florida]|uniref:disease resistance protein RUN1-like n=1 Tax=Cornus florida TaxID=4283 RepID=UPI00289B7C29|nr:disease resistance protein RUN1-like [Cornus florida]
MNTSLPPSNTYSLSTFPPATTGWDYEVFLSFRGDDTRKRFTDHLYCDLREQEIHTFRDNNALRLEENITEILNAIEHSKISIPILSKDYASSEWCLCELTKMVECKRTREHIIIPIFYDVKPSDVREQKGSYEEAFREHEKNFDGDTVEAWKEVGGLTGREVKKFADGHEGALVKDIISEVWEKLKRNLLDVNHERLVGIDVHVEKMMKFLSDNSIDVRIVGIHGMGGIGKTTIARVIYNNLSKQKVEFESCCFLADVREKSPDGLVVLQNQLVSSILKQGHSILIWSMEEGINAIKHRFSGKKVLVVVDDVDHINHLLAFALLGKCDWFGSGSRIIVTTRNKEILNLPEVDCRTYEPKELDNNQSLQLFSRHAFRTDHPPEDFVTLSRDVVSTTGGLPLALEVFGSLFIGIEKEEWEDKINKLKSIPHKDVMDTLKISYDALDCNQQQIFLDIACLFIGVDERIAVHMWNFPKTEIRVLRRRLVKIGNNNELRMHDQLRDLGRDIVRQENVEKPGKRSRVWFHDESIDVLETHTGTTKVKAICLNLKSESQVEDFELESHVKALCLTNEEFAILSNLRFLQMDLSNVTEDLEGWNYIKVSSISLLLFRIATKLKVPNLTGCKNMVKTPDFSSYLTLERLILQDCKSLVDIDPSIGHLKSLVFLNLKNCAKLNRLPLEFDKVEALTELLIDGTGIEEVPISRGVMKKLETLSATCCLSLTQILPSIDHLTSLLDLKFGHSFGVTKLPDSIGSLVKLQRLSLRYCKLKELPDSIGKLELLIELDLSSTAITELPDVETLPDLSNFMKVRKLSIADCKNLNEITGLDRLESLQDLNMSTCTSLERWPDLSKLEKLEGLNLGHCKRTHEIEGLEDLKSLKKLDLSWCTALEKTPDPSRLTNLETLRLCKCEKLSEICGFEELKLLRELDLSSCMALERTPDLS